MSDRIEVKYQLEDGKIKETIAEINRISMLFKENALGNMTIDQLLELETEIAGHFFYLVTWSAKEQTEKARSNIWRKVCEAGNYTIAKKQALAEIERKITDTELKNEAYLSVVNELNEELKTDWTAGLLKGILKSLEMMRNVTKDIIEDKTYERTHTQRETQDSVNASANRDKARNNGLR